VASQSEPQSVADQRNEAASDESGSASMLGFVAGGRHWLIDLNEVNEVVTGAEVTPVPWTREWFVGLTSVRGTIYGCTDLAAFLGLARPLGKGECRLLLAHPRFGVNAGFRIEQALGLRNVAGMKRLPADAADVPAQTGSWEDAAGLVWWGLSFEHLLQNPEFFQAGI